MSVVDISLKSYRVAAPTVDTQTDRSIRMIYNISEYQPLIKSVVINMAGRTTHISDIEDTIQNINIKLLDGLLNKYDASRGTIEMFIINVARSTTIDMWRRNTRKAKIFATPSDPRSRSDHDTAEDGRVLDHSLDTYDNTTYVDAVDVDITEVQQSVVCHMSQSALSAMLNVERDSELLWVLDLLNDSDKAFILAAVCDDYDIKARADDLGITDGALRIKKHRVLNKLKSIASNKRSLELAIDTAINRASLKTGNRLSVSVGDYPYEIVTKVINKYQKAGWHIVYIHEGDKRLDFSM